MVVGVVVVVLALVVGAVVVRNLRNDAAQAACAKSAQVVVAVPNELVPLTSRAVRTMGTPAGVSDRGCLTLDVLGLDASSAVAQMAGQAAGGSTVWILQSREQLPAGSSTVRVLGSAASTPVVVVRSHRSARGRPSTWTKAMSSAGFVLPDPVQDPASWMTIGALADEHGSPTSRRRLVDRVIAAQIARFRFVPDAVELLGRAVVYSRNALVIPIPEQQYIAVSTRHASWQLDVTVPADGTVFLDYPVVVRTDTGPTAAAVAQQLVRYFASSNGQTALGAAGFRNAAGDVLNARSLTGTLRRLRMPPATAEISTWRKAQTAASSS
ncbi:MAG: hypothetical protein ACRDP1_00800 [Nocardioidaceae bacterium]